MPKPVSPKTMRKLRALKRMKAEGQYQPKQQVMRALEARREALQAELTDQTPTDASPDPGALLAAGRHAHYVVGRLDKIAERKRAVTPALDAAKTQLKRAIAAQSMAKKD